MNTPATTPPRDDDAQLRQHLRDALTQSPAEDLSALESRTLAQWRLRVIDHQTAHNGPLAVIQAGWRHHPVLWRATLLAFGLAAVLLLQPWADSELATDELMQPDVLSLIAAGEL
jgi:hypothetical protein